MSMRSILSHMLTGMQIGMRSTVFSSKGMIHAGEHSEVVGAFGYDVPNMFNSKS